MSVSLRNVLLQEAAGAISRHWGISWRFFDDVIAFGPFSAAAYSAEALSVSDYWWGFPRGGEQVALLWFDRGESVAGPIVEFLEMLPDKARADLADGLPVSLDSLPDAARAPLQAVASSLPGIDLTSEPAPAAEVRRISWFGAEEFARNLAPYGAQVPHISEAQVRVAGGEYLLKDIIGTLGASARARIEVRPDIADTRLFVSEGNYNSNSLLGAACFAAGARVSQTSPSIWLAPLPNQPVMLAGPRKHEGEPLNVAVLGEPQRLARALGEGRGARGMFQGALIVFKRGGEVLLRVVALARTRPILQALESSM